MGSGFGEERQTLHTGAMAEYQREIEFERVLNFRDLGGYRAADGRTVRWRRLFRSGPCTA